MRRPRSVCRRMGARDGMAARAGAEIVDVPNCRARGQLPGCALKGAPAESASLNLAPPASRSLWTAWAERRHYRRVREGAPRRFRPEVPLADILVGALFHVGRIYYVCGGRAMRKVRTLIKARFRQSLASQNRRAIDAGDAVGSLRHRCNGKQYRSGRMCLNDLFTAQPWNVELKSLPGIAVGGGDCQRAAAGGATDPVRPLGPKGVICR